jgi:hypothetical protein
LVLERWRNNIVLDGLQLNFVSLWIQLHGLPLEYHHPDLAIRMGHILGVYERIDWDENLPRNIRFMCIRVRVDPWLPLMASFMLRLDNGDRIWIKCRYECVYKLCTKCGLISHSRAQCTYLMEGIEQFRHWQRQRIQQHFQLHYGFDPLEPHFVHEMRAFYNQPLRRNTQVRFGPLTRDTRYGQRQYQQGGPPPPQPHNPIEADVPHSHINISQDLDPHNVPLSPTQEDETPSEVPPFLPPNTHPPFLTLVNENLQHPTTL